MGEKRCYTANTALASEARCFRKTGGSTNSQRCAAVLPSSVRLPRLTPVAYGTGKAAMNPSITGLTSSPRVNDMR